MPSPEHANPAERAIPDVHSGGPFQVLYLPDFMRCDGDRSALWGCH